ncbi:tetrapyrrole biosynthesis, uroporphyrinogen III synthase [Delitschia confertaspora ATCC 74209]|uniref:Tetrapyrrole biosynthesis, uroporphyrinogen III synthase n=1 Tax=Delitschia confertaspora ATCC 74209 TaxID=1513339 RepID=A0A9P4JD16_9PLEO|nr:tetrapyrrole biosynthesis, uroporphyrinogen III synthase [Delitschia confertaspora ATCC 74209]
MAEAPALKVPVLLLKTKSAPVDGYEEYFSTVDGGRHYEPVFVPVLEHRFKQDALDEVRQCIVDGGLVTGSIQRPATYGAIIFTSQRAVEAFSRIVEDIRSDSSLSIDELLPRTTPFYVVGPATARGLRALGLPCPILGEKSGNGEVLSALMLEHYNSLYRTGDAKPPLLFMVGEKRRDVIPRNLQSEDLPLERRCIVVELVIYETGEMQSFQPDFSALLKQYDARQVEHRWVVVFSPTGCKAMLETLDILDRGTGKLRSDAGPRKTLIATIGPTTRDYLKTEFNFLPDVCAEAPSPEGGPAVGTKRKADNTGSSPAKRGRKAGPKTQTTIEESIANGQEKESEKSGEKALDSKEPNKEPDNSDKGEDVNTKDTETENAKPEDAEAKDTEYVDKETKDMGTDKSHDKEAKHNDTGDKDTSGKGSDAIQESTEREKKMPSSILEKGLLYIFTRNRVGMEEAESVGDLQRTYFVLRPLPVGAKLGDGAIPDDKNNRLFALPKKTFPQSKQDRFMAFVEKAKTTIKDLKDNFFEGDEYETKTMGTRHTENVTPVGEGVYAIIRSEDKSTHLAYMLTIPSELGEVQKDLGLREKGSFIFSVKNPERGGPANARLPKGPEFPEDIIKEFRGLAWVEANPKYLDFANAQVLLIGEGLDGELGKAVEPTRTDEKHGKEAPKEEIEALEHEDELRVEHLNGDDSVFNDLKLSKEEYSKVPTTW